MYACWLRSKPKVALSEDGDVPQGITITDSYLPVLPRCCCRKNSGLYTNLNHNTCDAQFFEIYLYYLLAVSSARGKCLGCTKTASRKYSGIKWPYSYRYNIIYLHVITSFREVLWFNLLYNNLNTQRPPPHNIMSINQTCSAI